MCTHISSDPYRSYCFRVVKNFYENKSLSKRLYSFKSTKNNQVYWVWVEFHPYNFIAIKFHLKNHRHCINKYHKLTDYNDARPIIFTCIKIMLEMNSTFQNHSFGFIGANTNDWIIRKDKTTGKSKKICINEPESNTKRYLRYKRFISTFISDEYFEHKQLAEKSAYLLLRKTELEKNSNLENDINIYFSDNFIDIFERS